MARVLHIEGDVSSRALVERLLTAEGHEVTGASSGLEGIRLASRATPDLILVDIKLPDLDGYEVTLRLRGIPELRGVPIVAITDEGDKQTTLAVGADGFIAKPLDPRRVTETVGRILGGYRERADETGEIRLREQSQRIVERLEAKIVELSEANARLEEMARLRREYLRNVSHELATPMTPVVGYLRLLLNEELGPLTPLQAKCLRSIDESTERLRGVVETLLDVSSLETGQMHFYARDYDFLDVVVKAVASVRPTLEQRGVSVREEPTSASMPCHGDAEKLGRAIVHILDNAAKFTPRGGEVAIAVRRLHPISGVAGFELLVADSGPGVAAADVERVLEPFYQADGSMTRSHGGVGLGLAFARRVTEALGGGLVFVSPPNVDVAGVRLTGTLARLRVAARPSTHGLEQR